jgi:hypothetical protein
VCVAGASSLQLEFHWNNDPDCHRLPTTARRFKAPAPHGLRGSLVEVGVAGGAFNLHVFDSSLCRDPHLQEHRPFYTLSSGQLRIAQFDLIPANGAH